MRPWAQNYFMTIIIAKKTFRIRKIVKYDKSMQYGQDVLVGECIYGPPGVMNDFRLLSKVIHHCAQTHFPSIVLLLRA